jgi:hypothetical protein
MVVVFIYLREGYGGKRGRSLSWQPEFAAAVLLAAPLAGTIRGTARGGSAAAGRISALHAVHSATSAQARASVRSAAKPPGRIPWLLLAQGGNRQSWQNRRR